ncbi:hypothetical protein DB354_03225 [Opitutus sp. ER46]|nr:hypothetical protein DB354_03225 [Opitutus sp. ER46]
MPFIVDSTLKDNIAYTLILADVLHWNLVRTDVKGTAEQMLTKAHMFLLGTIVESLTKEFIKGREAGACYKKRLEALEAMGVIDATLRSELEWLWAMRNRMHLFLISEAEYNLSLYSTFTHNRAVKAFRALLAALSAATTTDVAMT